MAKASFLTIKMNFFIDKDQDQCLITNTPEISIEFDEKHAEENVENIAYLSRLKLTGEEKKTFSKDLKNVFQWIDKLNHLCPDGKENDITDSVVGLKNLREDKEWDPSMNPNKDDPQHHEGPEDVLKNVPSQYQHYVLVPKIIS